MININIDGQQYALSFAHPTVEDNPRIQRKTICQLYAVDGNVADLLASNEAACSSLDNFRRSTGRKIALSRTLCQHEFGVGKPRSTDICLKCGSVRVAPCPLSKQTRTQIWQAYFDATAPRAAETGDVEAEG